jgi:hypothetical protein
MQNSGSESIRVAVVTSNKHGRQLRRLRGCVGDGRNGRRDGLFLDAKSGAEVFLLLGLLHEGGSSGCLERNVHHVLVNLLLAEVWHASAHKGLPCGFSILVLLPLSPVVRRVWLDARFYPVSVRLFYPRIPRPDLVECVCDGHLGLGVEDLGLELLHRIPLRFLLLEPVQALFLGLFRELGLPPRLEIPLGAALALVVHVLWVRLEGDLAGAAGAADVKAEDGDGVVFLLGRLLAGVELAPLVDELAAVGALHRVGRHEAHRLQLWAGILGAALARDLGRVEVGRVVFGEHFAFRHGGGMRVRVVEEKVFA